MTIKQLKLETPKAPVQVVLLGEGRENDILKEERAKTAVLAPKPGAFKSLSALVDDTVRTTLYGFVPKELTYDALEEMSAELLKELKTLKAKEVDILLGDDALKELSGAFYKQLLLMDDSFTCYQTTGLAPIDLGAPAPEKETFAPTFTLYLPESMDMQAEEGKLKNARHLAMGIRTARRLVNEPANVMSPQRLAEEASKLAEQHGFSIEVFDEKQIQQMGMEAFWSVAKGSDTPPRFLVMRYMNNPDTQELLALVGKGLTYDSGGYAVKPAAGMVTMHCDMGGSAAVIGALSTLAAMKAKVNVVGVVAACENMISGHAYRNGDIIGSLSGKYIEVVNTDAEGRLTLADAITYAATVLKADKIIDIATLTGAAIIALGEDITGVVADDESIWQAISQASIESGDKVWRLPHDPALAKHNKSERADIKNSGGRQAGTATAALFCRAFAFGKPWGHLDIAGTAYHEAANAKAPAGATGVGVELLTRAAIELFK